MKLTIQKNRIIHKWVRLRGISGITRAWIVMCSLGLAVVGISLAQSARPSVNIEAEQGSFVGQVQAGADSNASGGNAITYGGSTASAYSQRLQYIRTQPFRSTTEDDSPYRNYTMAQIDQNISRLFGPKICGDPNTAVVGCYNDGYFAEQNQHELGTNGEMRIGCEFSHFSYDDPIVYPGQPNAAHLHMFFGNTDVNAYSTWDTLYNSGGGTCNGGELNRTGYWVPALFDQNGNVRVPHFANIYYKHDNPFSFPANIEYYPDNAKIVSPTSVTGTLSFQCINEWGGDGTPGVAFIDEVQCPGGSAVGGAKRYFEHNVIFQNCWNGQDPSNTNNFTVSMYTYFGGPCPSDFSRRLPNIRYRLRYIVEAGDNTSQWYLSSDVNRTTNVRARSGSTNHGDWWGAWNKEVNRAWVDNCSNNLTTNCGYGYLDGRSYIDAPNGPALRYREKNPNLPIKIPAQQVYSGVCTHARTLQSPEQAAYCAPATGVNGVQTHTGH